ncbi:MULTISPECIES: roadblock/LC7 domain-containing protein [Streptomyces]|uniref:Roadblock/LC7 domain-containing protein n=1 Tax=Streptomyces morookaense TaxID=1970 RepID=A0A7Y7B5E5_STRMO|nr:MULTISPECIES: roadblock/LC7 domain-containing protein [Streptomyces]MCC2274119.1 roadblock/LC7 domain-containing protein [Streptomyces sp. ET3-23]NVK78926.1 roadblock/LC7 domain-containing protein [Streptomyces morookaense]GHF36115.1 dynein regulation protein LC7 [Streptomyces morookaense]
MTTDGTLHAVDPQTAADDVTWLIRNFVHATPGVRHAVAVSADGLVLAAAGTGLGGEAAERLAAVACGLVSLTRGAAEVCGTGWVNQTVVDMDGGFLCTMTISDGSALTVLTGAGCDIGLVAYEAARLVDRVGEVLTPEVRVGLRRMLMD